ncbi:MAG: beta-galactosidase trimerization domain-containing protein, partial [Victivallaceae bacterium]
MKVGPEWKQIKVTLQLPKDAKILGVFVRAGGDETSPNVFYVDDLRIEPGTNASTTEPCRLESDEQVKVKGVIPAAQTPVLDGRLGDPAWKNAMTIDKFYLTDGSGKTAPQCTEVKMLHDDKNIYFGFKCEEKNVDAMKCQSTPEKAVWSDDRVEIHANSLGYATPSAYFSVNADGVYTTKMPFEGLNLKPEIKTARGNGFWTAEIAIPAAAYGKAGLAGQTWYFSLGRFHRTSFDGASCIVPIKGGFNKLPEAFQPFVFGGGGAMPPVMVLTQGDMAAYSNNSGGNALIFQLNDKNLLSSELQLTVSSMVNGKSVSEQVLTAGPPFKNNRAVFYYNTAERENEMLNFTLKSDGKIIFSSGNNLDILCPPCRVFKTANPLFQELLKNGPAEKRTFIAWQHPVNEENYSLALKYAKPYSQAQRLRELKEADISIITRDATDLYKSLPSVLPGNYYWDREKLNMDALSEKIESGKVMPFTVYSYYTISGITPNGEKGVTLREDGYFGWQPDPINRQAYKDSVKAALGKHGTSIGIMWAGDEQFWITHDNGLKMNSPHNQANPTGFLEKANQEVKEKYGFGKFGIPWGMDSKSPDYPYCKRAYISWLHDKLLAVNKDTRAIVKAKYPDMPVMSDDAYGVPSISGVQYWYQYADAATFQLGEGGGSAERQIEQYAFATKMVKDLSGVKKLSVCPHEPLDGYPSGATTLEEARELYSQALRGGTDGFQYWPASFGGHDKPPVYAAAVSEGYPLAWQYMLEVTNLLNNTPPLKFPENTDTAIFVSDEALKCDSGSYDRFASAFTLLGSSAHAWFKFISDTMLEQGRAKLSDYKIIYVPYIQYVKEDTAKKLIEYVENGGTLICGDPKAFENDISSAPLTQYREKLFGVKSIAPDKSPDSAVCNIGSRKLPVDGERFRLQLDGKAKVIGSYADGSPAVVENRIGKGKAFYFGFVPFSRTAVGSS